MGIALLGDIRHPKWIGRRDPYRRRSLTKGMSQMRRIMKLAAVGAMTAGLVGAGASTALAGDYTEVTATEVAQCISTQEATGVGLLLGLGLNLNLLNSAACSGSVNVNDIND